MMGSSTPWIGGLLGADLPTETRSTCDRCAMLPPDAPAPAPAPGSTWFSPSVRCCTFEPALPNYVVGRILRDDDPALAHGRDTVRARLRRRADAVPWGLRTSARFAALYRPNAGILGRAPDLACPHLQAGDLGCGIWRHRPIVCATWYCKHDRGETGQRVWRALEMAVHDIEQVLGTWCVQQVGAGPAALADAVHDRPRDPQASDLGGDVDPAAHRARWGEWLGREEAFYVACAERVDALTWPDVLRLGGARLEALVALARQARARFDDAALPEHLTLGSVSIQPGAPGTVRLGTYSPHNPLQAPAALVQILPHFNGRRTHETLAAIERDLRLRLHADLVRTLVDFGVLRAAD